MLFFSQSGNILRVISQEPFYPKDILLLFWEKFYIFYFMRFYTKTFLLTFLSIFCISSFGFSQNSITVNYPESYYIFRDETMNDVNKNLEYYTPLYNNIVSEISRDFSGNEKEIILAKIEYFMGRLYRNKKQNKDAENFFNSAIERCKKILKKENNVEANLIQAECISQNCIIKSTAYAISNGPKIKTLSQKALDIDPAYGSAKYINNSQNIFTPAPFNNYKEGVECLDELLFTDKYRMDKLDIYFAYSAKGYVCIQEKDFEKARYWIDLALEIYPENQYLIELRP